MDYTHRISIDHRIRSAYVGRSNHIGKILLVEVRTIFVLKEVETEVHYLDSEVYHMHFMSELMAWTVASVRDTIYKRLVDYGMADDAIQSLSEEILHLAQAKRDEVDNVVPVALKIQVCTVKQESESLDECRERAIRASNLVPLRFCNYVVTPDNYPSLSKTYGRHLLSRMNDHKFKLSMDDNVSGSVLCRWCSKYTKLADYVSLGGGRGGRTCSHGLGKFRVEDPGPCHVCSKDIKVGQHISAVPTCLHLFHSVCILRWMDERTLVCPKCLTPAYDPPKDFY